MRVILAVDAIHRPLTGIGRYTWEIHKGLENSSAMTDVKYISHGRWVERPAALLEPARAIAGANTLRQRLAGSSLATAAYSVLMPRLMHRKLRSHGDYLFHSPNFFLPPVAGPALATFHDLSIYDHPEFHPGTRVDFMRREIPKTLGRANALIADSEFTRKRIIEQFDWPQDRVHTILLGVDHRHYAPPPTDLAKQTLAQLGLQANQYTLCVSTIEPRKNLGRLIRAYQALPDSLRTTCPLVLVGDRGWHSEEIHALVQSCSAAGWLRYFGYLPQEQMPAVLHGSALFVFPSLYEGFGLPVLEAMACGCPVLSSRIEPVVAFAGDSIGYFDPYDTEDLTSSLLNALDDSDWLEQAGKLAHARAEQFSWSKTVRNVIEVYEMYANTGQASVM